MKRNISNKTKEMEKTQSGKTIHEMLMFISQQRKKSLAEWTDCVFYLLEFPYVCKLLKSLFIQLYKAVKELDREKILSMKNSKHSNFWKACTMDYYSPDDLDDDLYKKVLTFCQFLDPFEGKLIIQKTLAIKKYYINEEILDILCLDNHDCITEVIKKSPHVKEFQEKLRHIISVYLPDNEEASRILWEKTMRYRV